MAGKKPTRTQRQILEKYRLNPSNWLVLKNPPDELYILHKKSGKQRIIQLKK